MKIKIIQVGKNKDRNTTELAGEFLKRISSFADLEVITLEEISPGKTFTKEKCIEDEGKKIMEKLKSFKDSPFVIALDEQGKEMDSMQFSQVIKNSLDNGREVVFVIGGPFGLSKEINSDLKLSFSRMTFTHQMIRLFLLEQIYRGFCIINKKEYHH